MLGLAKPGWKSLLSALLLGLAVLSGCTSPAPAPEHIFSDGTRVDAEVYSLLASGLEAEVIGEFTRKYGVEVDAQFWDQPLGGTTPKAVLDDQVESDYFALISMFTAGERAGLIDFTDFDGFLIDLRAENQRRADGKAAGATIYGPEQFSAQQYLDYLRTILKQKLGDN
jgi:hypothetical protein